MNTQHNHQFAALASRYQRLAVRLAFVIVIAALIASGARFGRSECPAAADAVVVAVNEGDTLWDLAVRYGPSSADPRKTVCEIRKANDIVGSLIHPGDTVRIPQG
jgi:nucleoid-associated protein YgaU